VPGTVLVIAALTATIVTLSFAAAAQPTEVHGYEPLCELALETLSMSCVDVAGDAVLRRGPPKSPAILRSPDGGVEGYSVGSPARIAFAAGVGS
jgi:hypothetical protein